MNVKVGLVSLGCAKNLVDSENLLGMLRERGMEIVPDPAEADVIFVMAASLAKALSPLKTLWVRIQGIRLLVLQ